MEHELARIEHQIEYARRRDETAAQSLGHYTPVEQILAKMSDQYALMAQFAAIVEAVANQDGVNCHCHGDHVNNCPVAEAIELVRRMSSL